MGRAPGCRRSPPATPRRRPGCRRPSRPSTRCRARRSRSCPQLLTADPVERCHQGGLTQIGPGQPRRPHLGGEHDGRRVSIYSAGSTPARQPLADPIRRRRPSATKAAVDSSFASAFGFSPRDSSQASTIDGPTDMQSYLDGAFASQFTPSGLQLVLVVGVERRADHRDRARRDGRTPRSAPMQTAFSQAEPRPIRWSASSRAANFTPAGQSRP